MNPNALLMKQIEVRLSGKKFKLFMNLKEGSYPTYNQIKLKFQVSFGTLKNQISKIFLV